LYAYAAASYESLALSHCIAHVTEAVSP